TVNPVDALLTQMSNAVCFDLEHPRYLGAPTFDAHKPGFFYSLHRRHEDVDERTSASGVIVMAEHSGTHIDALCHQAYGMEMFGGVKVTPDNQTFRGFTELAIDGVEPVITRGVLLDLPGGGSALEEGTVVSDTDLAAAAERQGTAIRPGDTVLIRTGNALRWQHPESYERGPGIGSSAAQWLADTGVHSVGADNVALDVVGHKDDELGHLPAHTILTVRNGIFIIENLNLEALAAENAHEFVFVCLPLKMRGATGSPVRPIALVPRVD
ncbi:MAG: cyclase family protein, partial [Acidimicrobiia bacterium]